MALPNFCMWLNAQLSMALPNFCMWLNAQLSRPQLACTALVDW